MGDSMDALGFGNEETLDTTSVRAKEMEIQETTV